MLVSMPPALDLEDAPRPIVEGGMSNELASRIVLSVKHQNVILDDIGPTKQDITQLGIPPRL
jgi:hypothetical protein